MATTGAPRSSHSWRMCARGSSPRVIATMGLRNPRPTSESALIVASTAAFTRGKRAFDGWGTPAALGGAAGAASGAAPAGSRGCTLLANDIATLDLLLAFQADREFVDVGIRLVAVVFDAVDELLGGCAESVGREIEVGGIRLLLRDELLGRRDEHVGAIHLLRGLEEPRIGLAVGNLTPAAHL